MAPRLQFARYRDIAARLANFDGEIIVASAGLATSIQRNAAELAGKPVSFKISTLDAFARRVLNDCGEYPHLADDSERRLAMCTALAASDDPMMESRGMVAMMERSYRDVRDSGISLPEFERRAREIGRRPRLQAILGAWKSYEQFIAALPAVDPADVLQRAAMLIESGRATVAPQAVAGFYDMTGSQLRLVSALAAAGKLAEIHVPVGSGASYAFAEPFVSHLNSVLSPQSSVLEIRAPKITVEQFPSKENELRGICAAIGDLLQRGTAASTIGIVARSLDPDDVRLLQRFASECGFAISARNDRPLAAHRIGRCVTAVLRLREHNFARGEVIDILRDGYRPKQRVRADRLDVRTRAARISGGRAVDIRNPDADEAIEQYRAVVSELDVLTPVKRALPGSGWASLLRHIGQKFVHETGLDLAAAGALDDLANLLGRTNEPVELVTVLELIESAALREQTTDNRPHVVWTGDVMKFRGRSFDHLFVMRAQEDSLPQRRVSDPLLPDSDRQRLGMRAIGDGREEERLLFQLLIDGASSSLRFSFSNTDLFGKTLRPSRMLRGFSVEQAILPVPTGEIASPPQRRQVQLLRRAGSRWLFDGYLFAEAEDEKVAAMIRNKLAAVSPTQLEDFGECPQKFLFKHIFGVEEIDDPERELQMHRREKGKLDHRILERFYRSLQGFPPDDVNARVDAIIDEEFDREEMRVPAFNRLMRDIERRATKRYLHAFLAADIRDLIDKGLQPMACEYTFGSKYEKRGPVNHPEPFVVDAHGIPMRVEGSIDRVDEGSDALRIVDYKSGTASRHKDLAGKIDSGVRLQLALYAMAAANFFPGRKVSGAVKPLMAGPEAKTMEFELGAVREQLVQTLDLFIASMMRGRFPAFALTDEDDACSYCPVRHSCRTKHSQNERRALESDRDPRTLLERTS